MPPHRQGRATVDEVEKLKGTYEIKWVKKNPSENKTNHESDNDKLATEILDLIIDTIKQLILHFDIENIKSEQKNIFIDTQKKQFGTPPRVEKQYAIQYSQNWGGSAELY